MPKIATLGSAKANATSRFNGEGQRHDLENIDILGNGPKSMKIWIYAGLALAAFMVYKSKNPKLFAR